MALHALAQCTARLLLAHQQKQGRQRARKAQLVRSRRPCTRSRHSPHCILRARHHPRARSARCPGGYGLVWRPVSLRFSRSSMSRGAPRRVILGLVYLVGSAVRPFFLFISISLSDASSHIPSQLQRAFVSQSCARFACFAPSVRRSYQHPVNDGGLVAYVLGESTDLACPDFLCIFIVDGIQVLSPGSRPQWWKL